MSYDITFRAKLDGVDVWAEVGDCDANITYNVRKMIELSTGLPWKNCENNGLCTEVIPRIENGLKELELHPEKYKPYEAKNGWGTVETTRNFYRMILDAWGELHREELEVAKWPRSGLSRGVLKRWMNTSRSRMQSWPYSLILSGAALSRKPYSGWHSLK